MKHKLSEIILFVHNCTTLRDSIQRTLNTQWNRQFVTEKAGFYWVAVKIE